jgi:preprotein translocase subunit YajC
MNEIYLTLVWLAGCASFAQLGEAPRPGGGAANAAGTAAAGGAAPAAGDPFGSLWTILPMMLGVMLIFMLISGRPQQKEQQRVQKLLSDLKRNDRVVTAGGIIGWVQNVAPDSKYVTLRIDEEKNVKMQVLKQSIVRVFEDDGSGEGGAKQSGLSSPA